MAFFRESMLVFQSTLPVWGGTSQVEYGIFSPEFQSTLPVWGGTVHRHRNIDFHRFQSTLPVWGGTPGGLEPQIQGEHFNPPSPCGEGQSAAPVFGLNLLISIHPPRVGRDRPGGQAGTGWLISIHPPRVGRDGVDDTTVFCNRDFNPPSPCGEGPVPPSGSLTAT